MKPNAPARLYFIVASEANVAVIFRKGPAKWVQLIKWNMDNDSFTQGQWFNGRIHERKCDLSPNGNLLVYFASKYSKRQSDSKISSNWTAVSKPPYFTAMGLWSNAGTTYGGGGLFIDDQTLVINHADTTPQPEFRLRKIKVLSVAEMKNEITGVVSGRWVKAGWKKIQDFKMKTGQPEIWEKESPTSDAVLFYEGRVKELEPLEKFYMRQSNRVIDIPGAQWVDWDHKGRLIVAIDGKILASNRNDKKMDIAKLKLLIDTNSHLPETFEAPDFATRQ